VLHLQSAIGWLANRVVEIDPLVSHILPLAEFQQGLRDFVDGKTLKVQLQPCPGAKNRSHEDIEKIIANFTT
jgi:hypothetical protein